MGYAQLLVLSTCITRTLSLYHKLSPTYDLWHSLQSAVSSVIPQQIHSIGNKFDDDVVLHGDLDNIFFPDKEVRYKEYESTKSSIFFKVISSKVSYS